MNVSYLETMESVLSKSNKVMVDVKKGNSMIYLPLDKIVRQRDTSQTQTTTVGESTGDAGTQTNRESRRDRFRSREVR